MSAERTPGTWYAERLDWEDGDVYWTVFAPAADSVKPEDPDVVSVASRLTEGDARLIAAAPELHDALATLLGDVSVFGTVVGRPDLVRAARAALAKATGEAP